MSKKCSSACNSKSYYLSSELLPAYPWEYIRSNVKTWQFIVMNYFTDLFNPRMVESISTAITRYIKKYVFPSWRVQVEIKFFVPPSQGHLLETGAIPNAYVNPLSLLGTFIPIYLVDQFGSNISPHFGSSVHGCVSGSVMNGIDNLFYLDNSLNEYGPLPFGTPFIVIPAGSISTGNGIVSEVASNKITGEGPTDYYQCLSLNMCHHIIEVLLNNTGVMYIGSGNPLGLDQLPSQPKAQIFYLKEAVQPFSQGKDNLFIYKTWTMTNFAYPAYFFPFNNSGVYDFLHHASAPFTPYKGTQFVIYQQNVDGVISELNVGNYISSIANPAQIVFVDGGSIYEYSGWGLTSKPSDALRHRITLKARDYKNTDAGIIESTHTLRGVAKGFHNGRRVHATYFGTHLNTADVISSFKATIPKGAVSTRPALYPFEYIDEDGFLTARFAIVNYSPQKLPPQMVDDVLPVLEKYALESYLPFWNIKAKFIANYTIRSPSDIPIFDGTFIPFFVFPFQRFNFQKLGGLVAGGGATNVNNVSNILAGPYITEYVLDPPNLPLANPYLMISDANFPDQVIITTDQPGLGPFIGAPSGKSLSLDINYPIIAKGAVASPDLSACSPEVGNMTGKIGINVRSGCDSSIYPVNMENAGAIATLTIFAGGAQSFSCPTSTKLNCTLGPEGQTLIDAVTSNPNIIITINAPVPPTDLRVTINTFSSICAHEMCELLSDPQYAIYIATSNPPVDGAILFSQYEASDPVESLDVVTSKCKQSFKMNPFPTPAYFVANLRYNNYDNTSTIYAPLIPQSRQQIVYQQKGNPLQGAFTLGILSSGEPDLTLETFGSIFDPQTFYPPGNPISYQNGGFSQLISTSPLASIYDKLLNQRNIFLI